jgi:glycosyltransferase involved in cell wall biosynthesis
LRDDVKKLLWIGDAAVATGFARCTHKTLETLKDHWDVSVLGLNYRGDPHSYPYLIYPCWIGGDAFGVGRVGELCRKIRPDVVVIQNDPWNISAYLDPLVNALPISPKIVAVMPVDGKNVAQAAVLNRLDHAIFWTEFGAGEANRGGYNGPVSVIPLGIDLELYKPIPQDEARASFLPSALKDAFIVGCLNRNQPRKRLDLLIEYFAEWVKRYGRTNAYLFLHVCPTGDLGYDVKQLMKYYGFTGNNRRLILSEPDIGQGIPEEDLPKVYSTFDVQLSTTQGEGWGLTTMEGMACGVPQIVPDWSALGEWTGQCAFKVPCRSTAVTPNFVNVVGGIPGKEETVECLDMLYRSKERRQEMSLLGLQLVQRPEFQWSNIGQRFVDVLGAL